MPSYGAHIKKGYKAMTSREFIAKTIGTESNKERSCSRVFTDREGIVYSYGYHYPLATIINGLGFVNNAGYSATTSRPIGWAGQALGEKLGYANVYSVPLGRGMTMTARNLLTSAEGELNRLEAEMASKKRKDTWVYKNLVRQANNMTLAIQVLKRMGV